MVKLFHDICPECNKELNRVKRDLGKPCHICGIKKNRKLNLECKYAWDLKLNTKHNYLLYKSPCPICKKELWRRIDSVNRICQDCAKNNKPDDIVARNVGLEYKLASEMGYKSKRDYYLFKDSCPDCHTNIWRRKRYLGMRCVKCASVLYGKGNRGKNHPNYKGIVTKPSGYKFVTLSIDDPYISMADKYRKVQEHRYVMAKWLGRPLLEWEIVHHRDGIRSHNKIENLELMPNQATHNGYTAMQNYIRKLEAEISELKNRITLLEAEQVLRLVQI